MSTLDNSHSTAPSLIDTYVDSPARLWVLFLNIKCPNGSRLSKYHDIFYTISPLFPPQKTEKYVGNIFSFSEILWCLQKTVSCKSFWFVVSFPFGGNKTPIDDWHYNLNHFICSDFPENRKHGNYRVQFLPKWPSIQPPELKLLKVRVVWLTP